MAMETLESESKKRVLPSWMTAPVDERRVLPARTPKRKRTAAVQVGAAARWGNPGSGCFSVGVLAWSVGRAVRWGHPSSSV